MEIFELINLLKDSLENNKRFIVLLEGEMGAGKTTHVSKLLGEVLPELNVHSPTFQVINQYAENIYHMDLYRLERLAEFENLGLEEILSDDNIVFIEWFEKVPQHYFEFIKSIGFVKVAIEKISDNERRFTYENSAH